MEMQVTAAGAKRFQWAALGCGFALMMTLIQDRFLASVVFGALAVTLGAIAYAAFFREHQHWLATRIAQAEQTTWEADIDGIVVGRITDADHARIVQTVWRDPHTLLRQIFNVGVVIAQVLGKLIEAAPPAAFFGTFVALLWFPADLHQAVDLYLRTGPEQLSRDIAQFFHVMFPFFVVLGVALMAATGYWPGFRNCYSADIQRRLRRQLRCPQNGEIVLSVKQGDDVHFARSCFDLPDLLASTKKIKRR